MSRRLVNVAALVAGAAVLSACGTGLGAKTYTESGRSDSGAADLGDVLVRNLHVDEPLTGNLLPAGSEATVSGLLVNSGTEDDALVSASSTFAGQAVLQESSMPTDAIPVLSKRTSTTTWSIVLKDLKQPLRAGQFISVTVEFKNAGHATLQVPVRAANNGLSDRPQDQDPYKSAE